MRKCPNCGYRLEDDQLECPNCKTKLEPIKPVKKPSNTLVVKNGKSTTIVLGARNIDERNAAKTPNYIRILIFIIPFFTMPAGAINLSIFVWQILDYNNVAKLPREMLALLSIIIMCLSAVAFVLSLVLQLLHWRWIETKAPAKVKSIFTPATVYAGMSLVTSLLYPIINHFIFTLIFTFLCGLFMFLTGPTLFKQYNILRKAKVGNRPMPTRTVQDIGDK